MSDFSIYRIGTWNTVSTVTRFESVGNDTFTIIDDSPSANFPANEFDIVKVTVVHNGVNKVIYAVYNDQTYDGTEYRLICDYDSDVYGGVATANTAVERLEIFALPSTSIVDLKSYNLSPKFSVATYGKNFTPYNYEESYTITAPSERITFDSSFKALYNNYDDKVLVDTCNNRAYGVSPTDITAVAVNGRIKSALNFNVLIK